MVGKSNKNITHSDDISSANEIVNQVLTESPTSNKWNLQLFQILNKIFIPKKSKGSLTAPKLEKRLFLTQNKEKTFFSFQDSPVTTICFE